MDVVDLGGVFYDTGYLPIGIFRWLQGIHLSHLVYCSGDVCELAPYFPIRFARQFGYDQLYVCNPYNGLAHCDNLIDGAKVLRYFIMFSTSVTF